MLRLKRCFLQNLTRYKSTVPFSGIVDKSKIDDLIYADPDIKSDEYEEYVPNFNKSYSKFPVLSRMSDNMAKREIIKSIQATEKPYFNPLTNNLIKVHPETGELIEIKDSAHQKEEFGLTLDSHESLKNYVNQKELYLPLLPFEDKTARMRFVFIDPRKFRLPIYRFLLEYYPQTMENKFIRPGGYMLHAPGERYLYSIKIDTDTNQLVLARDGKNIVDHNEYSAHTLRSVGGALAHTHPSKPVSFPYVDTREYSLVGFLAKAYEEDWNKLGFIGKLLFFGLLFYVSIRLFVAYNMGFTQTHNPYGPSASYSGHLFHPSIFVKEGDKIDREKVDQQTLELEKVVKKLINSDLLSIYHGDEYREKFNEISPYLDEEFYFAQSAAYQKLSSFCRGKENVKVMWKRCSDYRKWRKENFSPQFIRFLDLLVHNPILPIHGMMIPDDRHEWNCYNYVQAIVSRARNLIESFPQINRGFGEMETIFTDKIMYINVKNYEAIRQLNYELIHNKTMRAAFCESEKPTKLYTWALPDKVDDSFDWQKNHLARLANFKTLARNAGKDGVSMYNKAERLEKFWQHMLTDKYEVVLTDDRQKIKKIIVTRNKFEPFLDVEERENQSVVMVSKQGFRDIVINLLQFYQNSKLVRQDYTFTIPWLEKEITLKGIEYGCYDHIWIGRQLLLWSVKYYEDKLFKEDEKKRISPEELKKITKPDPDRQWVLTKNKVV